MFKVTKRVEIAGSHSLTLPYESPCSRIHGHNWIVEVEVSTEVLDNAYGMVLDFSIISRIVRELDHRHLNDIIPFNPTAENIALYLHDKIQSALRTNQEKQLGNRFIKVTKVTVQESEGNVACYTP